MELFTRLKERFPRLECECNFCFARHTTIGCGGIAAVAAYPSCAEETAELLAWLGRERIPYCFLGAGANVLPSDGAFDGVVVRFCRLNALGADGAEVFSGAGVTGGAFLSFAEHGGIGGFSPFSGIPMTIGGGTAMNAGVRELHFSDVVQRVLCVESGRLRILEREDCAFREKDSLFLRGIAVVGVWMRGKLSHPADIARESCYFRARRSRLPKGRSMGCTFVNPAGISAGELIERCGLKGARRGGAVVSGRHANFILNEGASGSDVAALIEFVKEQVEKQTGIALQEEIRRIP